MELIHKAKENAKRFEGFVRYPSECPAGKPTIGYGRNIEDNPLSEQEYAKLIMEYGVTRKFADWLLENDIKKAYVQARLTFSDFDEFPMPVQEVVIDMLFNLGAKGFATFRQAIIALYNHKWDRFAEEIKDSRWFKQVGRRGVENYEKVKTWNSTQR